MTEKRWVQNGTLGANILAGDSTTLSQVIPTANGAGIYVADGLGRWGVGAEIISAALGDGFVISITNTAGATATSQVYFRLKNGLPPSVAQHLMGMRNASGNAISTRLNTTGTVQLYDAAGANPVTMTPSPAMVDEGVYCLEIDVTPNASTSTGTGRCRLYDDDDTLIADTGALTGKNYGSAPITTLRIGDPDTALGTGYDIVFGGPAINTAATLTAIAKVAKTALPPVGVTDLAWTGSQWK